MIGDKPLSKKEINKRYYEKNKVKLSRNNSKKAILWRKSHPLKARLYDKKRHNDRKEKEKIYQRKYKRKIDPIKLACRTILNNAIKLGKIEKGDKCEKCGNEKVEAHHPDYNYPLDVEWLCSKCHAFIHHPY